jgi:hypothetical protein
MVPGNRRQDFVEVNFMNITVVNVEVTEIRHMADYFEMSFHAVILAVFHNESLLHSSSLFRSVLFVGNLR